MLFLAGSCFQVKAEKSPIVRQIHHGKLIPSRVNVYNPSNSPPQLCIYVFSVKPYLRKVRACSIKTRHSHGIQESAHLVFFTWSLLHLISDLFSDTLFTIVNALATLAFLIKAAAALGLLILFWLSRSVLGYVRSGGSNCQGLISPTDL